MFPSDETPPLKEVEAKVAELCGTINVATAALVDVLGGLRETKDWAGWGYRSLEHWVTVHCGVSAGRAKGLVRIAARARELPETLAKFREGALSEDQVRPIAQHVPAGFEASVASFARYATAGQVARTARSYSFPAPKDAADPVGEDDQAREQRREQQERRRQSVRFAFNPDGSWSQTASLPSHDGAVVQKALEAAREEIFRERQSAGDTTPQEAQVTWADALVRTAEHALTHMSNGKDSRTRDRHQILWHLRPTDASGTGASGTGTGTTGVGAGADGGAGSTGRTGSQGGAGSNGQANDGGEAGGQAWLHLGPAISPTIARWLSCDCHLRVVLENDHGRPVNVGRKHRIVPDHTRRVVEDRDRGCRYPGCSNTRWVDCHHIVHWEHGGPTDSHNLVSLCRLHHRLLHLGYISIAGNADKPHGLTFTNRYGQLIPNGPRPVPPTRPPPQGNWIHPAGERLDTACVYFRETA